MLEFLSNYWWGFLAGSIIVSIFGFYYQLRSMKSFFELSKDQEFSDFSNYPFNIFIRNTHVMMWLVTTDFVLFVFFVIGVVTAICK